MPRTAIAVQQVAKNSGAQLTSVTPDQPNGNIVPNDGNTELIVHNGDASSKTVTITSVPCSHGRTQNLAVVVAAGERAVIGPLDTGSWNQSGADAGKIYVDWSASTSVKVAARQIT